MPACYRYDQILILSKRSRNELTKELPVKELRDRSFYLNTICIKKDSKAYMNGYRTSINIVAPSSRFLQIMRKKLRPKSDYAIIKLEIARDVKVDSLARGDDYVENLARTTCKRWGKESGCFRQEEQMQDRDNFESNKGSITFYLDNEKQFSFVTYSRQEKLKKNNGSFCVRQEFRIKGSRNIYNKVGVESIGDLIRCSAAELYEQLEEKYIYYQDYDFSEEGQVKVGKLMLGIHGNTVIEREPDESHLTTRERMTCPYARVMLASALFNSTFRGKPYMDCIRWEKEIKKARKERKLFSCSSNNIAT